MSRKSNREAYARLLGSVVTGIKSQPPEIQHKLIWQWFFVKITIGIFVCIFIFSGLFKSLGPKLLSPSVLNNAHFETVAFCFLCALAVGLYALREKFRYLYGAIEISFSIALIIQTVEHLKHDGIIGWPVAGAAVYVLVRGLDNFVTGYKNPPPFNAGKNG